MRAESTTRPSINQAAKQQLSLRHSLPIKPELKTQEVSKKVFDTSLSDEGSLMYIDAGIRGTLRYLENMYFKGNPLLRIPFRAAAEFTRHSTSGALGEMLKDNKVTKKVLFPVARKTLENTLATAVFEPANFQGRFTKMAVGFANMTVRLTARILLAAMDVVDPADLDVENVADDVLGRSVFRGFWFDTKNPISGILVPTLEQLGINQITHFTPLKNMVIPKIKERVLPVLSSNF